MILLRKILFYSAIILLCFTSCVKQQEFSNTPTLTLKSISQFKDSANKDSLLLVYLDYTDGDGDLGLTESDTQSPFGLYDKTRYNLIVEVYMFDSLGNPTKMVNPLGGGGFDYFGDTIHYSQRIKNLTPEGNIKAISGAIVITIVYLKFL